MIINIRGTNGCLIGDTLIDCPRDLRKHPRGIPIRELVGKQFWTYSWDFTKDTLVLSKVLQVWKTGRRRVYRVKLSAYSTGKMQVGRKHGGNQLGRYVPPLELVGTFEHPVFLCDGTEVKLGELRAKDSLKSLYRVERDRGLLRWSSDVVTIQHQVGTWAKVQRPASYYALVDGAREQQFVCEATHGPRPDHSHVHHLDGNKYNHIPSNLIWKDITEHHSDHLRERNLAGISGWKVSGVHPRGMLGKRHTAETRAAISVTGRLVRRKQRALNHKVIAEPELLGIEDVYDMEVEGTHNFVANGVFVHNSGKSTIARSFLEQSVYTPLYGICGPRRPEAYLIPIGIKKLFLLGPYESPTGGADAITGKGFDVLLELADRYRERGNILFEGVAISNSFGQVGEWLLKHKNQAIVAFMDTPLGICLHALGLRQEASGNAAGMKHVAEKYHAIQRVKQRMVDDGIRVEDISRKNGTDKILGWLT